MAAAAPPVGAAPLVATDGAPVPQGARAFWFEGTGGARLRAAVMPPLAPVRGSVIVSPGRTEPIEKYFEVAGELQRRGFCVVLHDWRGQGLSHRMLDDRLKGHAEGHADFLKDFDLLLRAVRQEAPRPWIALGHSMGGTLTALAIAKGCAEFAGAFLSAPMMGVAAVRQLPRAAGLIAHTLLRLGRAGDYVVKDAYDPMHGPFAGNILTHDEGRYETYRRQLQACPDLALGGVTWGWLAFALDASVALARPAAALAARGMPMTVAVAGDERLVLNGPARRYAEHAGARYVEVAGAYHELLMETDARRGPVWRAFDDLATQVSPPRP